MGKVSRIYVSQSAAKILLLIFVVMSLILRVRKMIHYSMIGEDPTGFDWYMMTLYLIALFLLTWELLSKFRKSDTDNLNRQKVSRKTYLAKQNQATGPLLVAILAFLMLCFKGYMIFFGGREPGWDLYVWAIMLPILVVTWRVRERKLQRLEIEE